ncbi:MAG: SGNH/GDSL hydrolase family protein [Terriglobales bacterium]
MRRLLLTFVLLPLAAIAAPPRGATRWVGSWASAQMAPGRSDALPAATLHDFTLREIVHLSIGGSRLRVRLANDFSAEPLRIAAVHVALSRSLTTGEIDPATDRALTFAGRDAVAIPAGAEYVSDPVALAVLPRSNLAVTFYFAAPPASQTSHPGSHADSYLAAGDQVSAPVLQGAQPVEHWYFLAAVDVRAAARAVVCLGDSITDGHASTLNGNDRWPDDLAARLKGAAGTGEVGVLNEGIGGNRLLRDGTGPNALARFDRDVLGQSGARYLIVLEGINDLGVLTRDHPAPEADHERMVRRIIAAYQQIILRAHAHGLKVMGATITPDGGPSYYHPGPASEADRQAINAWIRAPGHFDAVVDFDRVIRDPAHPDQMLPVYDSGDHLHPGPAGYKAMAAAIPLRFFERAR